MCMKPTLLILHGAIGASQQLKQVAAKLPEYEIHLFDFPGHGGDSLPAEDFSIPFFADATVSYIRKHNLRQLTVLGYSMGGYVAMYVARHFPDLIQRIITLGTKFYWDEAVAAKEIKMLDAATIITKVPAFAATLATLHAPEDWKTILQRTAEMMTAMGKKNPLTPEDYKEIKIPCLIMLGDQDKMVTLDETVAVYKQLPVAQMAMLPGTPHPIEQVDPSLLAYLIQLYPLNHL